MQAIKFRKREYSSDFFTAQMYDYVTNQAKTTKSCGWNQKPFHSNQIEAAEFKLTCFDNLRLQFA